MHGHAFERAGERLVALPDRALFMPERGLLLIADLHLGKDDAFRRAGLAVPEGSLARDLSRLDALLARTGAHRLTVLGDLLHGPVHVQAPWLAQWRGWRARQAGLEFTVVPGNHDRALDADRLAVTVEAGQVRVGGLCLQHAPDALPDAHVVAGHLHPVVRVRGRGLDARVPAFWLRPMLTVLPAFSVFTGGYLVRPRPGDTVWLCAQDRVLQWGHGR